MHSLNYEQSFTGPLDPARFSAAHQAVSSEVDTVIAQLDAASPKPALDGVNRVIDGASDNVKVLAGKRMTAFLVKAAAAVSSSLKRVAQIVEQRAALQLELAALSPAGWVQRALAVSYILASGVAFVTEYKLTDSFTDVLGYRLDDNTAKWMCAAFALTLLVFELFISKLKLVIDPWPLLLPSRETTPPQLQGTVWRSLRISAWIVHVLVIAGIALLCVATIMKMVPMREIASEQRAHPKAELTPMQEEQKHQAVLYFSLCVLVSGGYLAAAGAHELRRCLYYLDLKDRIKHFDLQEQVEIARLDKEEKPALSAELAVAGLPFLWLVQAKHEDLGAKLSELQTATGGFTPAVAAAAGNEAGVFNSEKQIALEKARTKQPPPPPRKSTTEVVDDTIRGAVSCWGSPI